MVGAGDLIIKEKTYHTDSAFVPCMDTRRKEEKNQRLCKRGNTKQYLKF